jgi:superfamily II DNA or RNA helicase
MKKSNKISPKNKSNYEEINKIIENLKKNNLLNNYLGNKGYTLYKVSLDEKIINFIKSELIAKPFVQSSLVEPHSFPIYQESTKKIYVPRFWGLNIFGEPKEIKISQGKSINLKFNGQLRDYQENVINHYFKSINFDPNKKEQEQTITASSSALIELTTGGGKTVLALKILEMLKKKTIIFVQKTFLKNQWIERIQQFLPDAKIGSIQGPLIDIENKDIVIAMVQSISMKSYPDSLFDDFGFSIYDECFKGNTLIHTNKGKIKISDLYELWEKEKLNNNVLILSFNKTTKNFEYKELTYGWKKQNNNFVKITLSKQKIECTLNHKILTPHGYIEADKLEIGSLILSKYDSNNKDNLICPCLNDDQLQIIYGSYLGDGCLQLTKKNRYRLRIIHCKEQKEYCNWKAEMFNIYNINYIENNGYSKKEAYSFNTKCFDLKYDLSNKKNIPDWLIDEIDARGIAIWFMDDGSITKNTLKDGTDSYFAKISSNNFDYDNHNKIETIFKKFNIEIKIYKTRNYYEISFNKENTIKLFDLIRIYNHSNMDYKLNTISDNKYIWNNKFLDYGTLIVTSKEYINHRITNVYDIEVKDNHNFIIGTKSDTNYIDGPIVSNCHHMSSEVFCNCLKKCNTLYGLGLSATMERKDGLTNVFKMYLGDICYKNKATIREDNVLVKAIDYIIKDDDEYNEVETDFRGNIKHTTMISKVAKYDFRNDFILNVLYNEFKIKPDQQIILLSQTKNMLNYLYKELNNKNVLSCGYYVGGMKEQDLKISETKQVILATYSMAAEALDIPTLTTLVLATSKSDIVQAVGRILRMKHERPMIIDIIDQHSCFLNQFNKRRSLYNERNYKIIRTNNTKYIEYIKQINSNNENKKFLNLEDSNEYDVNIWQTLVYKPRKKNNKPLNNIKNDESSSNDSKLNVNEENSGICLI